MNLKVTDTHAHYDDSAFDCDRFELLKEITSSSAENIITIGCSLESSRKAIEIAENFPAVYASVGIHPSDCIGLPSDYTNVLYEMSKH